MAEQDPTFTIILAEIAAILLATIIIMMVTIVIRARKKSRLLSELVTRKQDSQPERQEQIQSVIKALPAVNQEKVSSISAQLFGKEADLYRDLIGIIFSRKISSLNEFDAVFDNYLQGWSQVLKESAKNDNSSNTATDNEAAIPDIDDAIDELISEDTNNQEKDPAFDLGKNDEEDQSEIAEIPADLLDK
jgi:hypothetical protein